MAAPLEKTLRCEKGVQALSTSLHAPPHESEITGREYGAGGEVGNSLREPPQLLE